MATVPLLKAKGTFRYLLALLFLLLTACAGNVRLDRVREITVCDQGECGSLDQMTNVTDLHDVFYRFLKSGEGGRFGLCSSSPASRQCVADGLSHYVQGGPIPGFGTFKGMNIDNVVYDNSANAIVAVVDPELSFIGIPLITTRHEAILKVVDSNKVSWVDNMSYTNWMLVGNQLFSFNFAPDYMDISRGVMGGWYGWGLSGIGTGGGDGYALISLPRGADTSGILLQDSHHQVGTLSGVDRHEINPHADSVISLPKSAHGGGDVSNANYSDDDSLYLLAEQTQEIEEDIINEERKRLDDLKEMAEIRRKELETLRNELELQREEAIRLQEERSLAEIEHKRLEGIKAEELERIKAISIKLDFGNYYALIIGNNEYKYFPKLKTAINDSKAVEEILSDDYGFRTTLLLDATRSQILRAISDLRKTLEEDDNLLIYYAGHGLLDKDADEGYWLPVDATPDDSVNWISNASITTLITAIKAKHVMLIADSCYSGKLTRGIGVRERSADDLERLTEKRARVVMTSGGLEPVVDTGSGNNSFFASAFLGALSDNKGIIEGNRLFEQIRRLVMVNTEQTPEYADIHKAGHDGGDFIFVRPVE